MKYFISIGLSVFLMVSAAPAENLMNVETYRPMAADRKAFRVGDILTVMIYEEASAQASAGTDGDKSTSLGARFGSHSTNKSVSAGLENDFSGGGRIHRSGRLLATVTVQVDSVEPNGDLRIRGEQTIGFNNEEQNIRLEGLVRPVDISPSNTVLSTRVANANIQYIGEGFLGQKQKPGFLSWLLSLFGLF